MKTITITLFLFFSCFAFSQVGVGNTDPKSTLDISASSTTSPTNEDGILIPRIDNFPTTDPTADQDGMMVFYTGSSLSGKGFYYWDNGSGTWVAVGNNTNDSDWLELGTYTVPDDINDNIYHLGQIRIGSSSINPAKASIVSTVSENRQGLANYHSGSDASDIGYALYNQSNISDIINYTNFYNVNSGTHNSLHWGIRNYFNNNGTGTKYGLENEFDYTAPNGQKIGVSNRFEGGNSETIGVQNSFPGAWTITGNIRGIYNLISAPGNGQHYGLYSSLFGSGSGNKYGTYSSLSGSGTGDQYGNYVNISNSESGTHYGSYNYLTGTGAGYKYGVYSQIHNSAGGIHYGVWSAVDSPTGYAGYFIGRTSLGDSVSNRYLMPAADGTAGQVMTTDGAGNVTFQDIVNDSDWVEVGANIERQAGNVYIGDNNATDNNLYISNHLIDWDDTTYFINPNESSIVNSIKFDDGSELNPSIYFSDLDSGFFSPSTGTTGYSSNGNEAFRIQSDGELSINTTTPSQFNFTVRGNVSNNEVRMGNWGSTSSVIEVDHDHSTGNGIYVETSSGHNTNNRSTIATYNSLTNIYTDISRYESGFNSFGVKTSISTNYSGVEYGIYSDVQTTDGYAAYLLGRTSLGNSASNRYIMPLADGATGQVIMTDGSGNLTFQNIIGDGNTQNTLDQSYDEGGAGAGKNITADSGALRINGNDGFLVTGTLGSGNFIDSEVTGVGTRMFFNPNKAAFRAGYVSTNQWDNTNIGSYSVAFGSGTTASGEVSSAFGAFTIASGQFSMASGAGTTASGQTAIASGTSTTASGDYSTAFGYSTLASGNYSTVFGNDNTASGQYSSVFGNSNTAPSAYETVIGINSTNYTPNSTTSFNNNDRLFVVGNGSMPTMRSNALTIYKDGRMTINDAYTMPTIDGTAGQVMTTDGAGNVTFQNPTTNTDDQQIDNLGLVGTLLGISLEDDGVAPVTVDLASINTDNQQIDNFSFNSTTNILTLEIEDDGQAAQTVDLSSLNPTKSIARMYMSLSQTETGGGVTKVNFDTVDFDTNSNFNTTTDEFTVPADGIYRVTAQITLTSSTGTGVFGVRIRVDGSQERRSEYNHHGNGELVRQVTSILNLTAGQTIDVSFARPAVGATIDQNSRATFFEIEQL